MFTTEQNPSLTKCRLQGPYNATPEPEDLEGTAHPEPWDLEQIFDRVILFAGKLSKRFRKPKKVVEEAAQAPSVKPGGEIAQELTDAWNLYTRVSTNLSPELIILTSFSGG